jgi:YgiT-type zinc finger domain-containing protein
LHAKIIRFDDQNMKLFPLSLIRAILYVKKIDKQKNLKKCPSCNSQRVKRKIEKTTYTYKNHSLKVDQPGIYCDNCGEIFLSSDDMRCNKTELEKFKNKINESNS